MAAPDRFTTAGSLADMHHANQLKGQSFRKVGNEPVTVIAYLLLKRALIKKNLSIELTYVDRIDGKRGKVSLNV
jgi:hypothetical protein